MTWAFLKPMKLAPKLSIIDFPSSVAGFHHLKYAPSTLLSLTESDKHVQTLSHRRAIKNLRQMSCCFPFDYFYYPSFHCEWWFWCSSEKDNCISVQHLSSIFSVFLQSVFLLSQRKPVAFLFSGVGVSVLNLPSARVASIPGPNPLPIQPVSTKAISWAGLPGRALPGRPQRKL